MVLDLDVSLRKLYIYVDTYFILQKTFRVFGHEYMIGILRESLAEAALSLFNITSLKISMFIAVRKLQD